MRDVSADLILLDGPGKRGLNIAHPENLGVRGLLDGLVTDPRGTAFGVRNNPRPRFYISERGDHAAGAMRVPIVWLDRFVSRLLRRIEVLGPLWSHEDIVDIVRKVKFSHGTVLLELRLSRCFTRWREQDLARANVSERKFVQTVRGVLPNEARIKRSGPTLLIRVQHGRTPSSHA